MTALRRAFILLACALSAAAARATDSTPPLLSNFSITNCTGAVIYNAFDTSTGTPDMSLVYYDTGPAGPYSGLRLGQTPHGDAPNVAPGTVELLHLDGSWADGSGYGNVVTGASGVQWASNVGLVPPAPNASFGNSLYWSADGDYISVPASGSLGSVNHSMTLQAWIRPTDVASSRPILEWNDNAGHIGVHLWLGAAGSGSLYANIRDSSLQDHVFQSATGVVAVNAWQLVTLTMTPQYDAAFYVNDVRVATKTIYGINAGRTLATTYALWAGYRPGGASFRGYIDEIRILNRAITDIDVAGDYDSGLLQRSPNPNGPWVDRFLTSAELGGAGEGATTPLTLSLPQLYLGASEYFRIIFQDKAGNTSYVSGALATETIPPTPPNNPAGAAGDWDRITWSWEEPTRLCLSAVSPYTRGYYQVLDADTLAVLNPAPIFAPTATYLETGLTANALARRIIRAVDAYGPSDQSALKGVYTNARDPAGITSSNISANGITVGWSPNGNANYTRYEVTLWSPGFGTAVSTPVAILDNMTASSWDLAGLSPGTTYYIRVRARNSRSGQSELETQYTNYLSTVIPTLPAGPQAPDPAAAGTTSILWSWPAAGGGSEYILEASTGGNLTRTPGLSFLSTGLSINSRYGARLRVLNQSGMGNWSGYGYGYTDANPPAGSAITNVSSGSLTLSWSQNNNPDPTSYEVQYATNSGFTGTAYTRSTSARSSNFTDLLPGTTYYFHVRAVSYNGRPTSYDTSQKAVTSIFGPVTSTQTAPSPYDLTANTVGLWHFDQSSGTVAYDSGPFTNNGTLTCTAAACSSTPTYTAGLPGLGRALSFTGLSNSVLSVPDANNSLDLPGSFTLEAWVNPGDTAQYAHTTIVSKGLLNQENYVLEVLNGKWNFMVRNGGFGSSVSVASTQTIRTGWTHLACVYDTAAGNVLRIYVDGVLSNTQAGAPNPLGTNNEEFTIGARKTGAGLYGYAFRGLVDEVRVQSRALAGSDVAFDYDASRTSAVVWAPEPSRVKLILPPDAFGGTATIMFSTDPLNNGILINRQTANDALAAPPTGQTLVPGSFTEVVVNKAGFPFVGTLGSSAAISITYPDDDANSLVDGTFPPISAQQLKMYTLDTTVLKWIALPSSVDLATRRVTGLTSHFSVFALFGPSGIKADTKDVYIYPVPWKPGSGGAFDSAFYAGREGLAIANLSTSGTVRIFTLSGERVADLSYGPADIGTILWDGKNNSGRDVASGVYFAYIKGGDGTTKIVKFAVER